MHDVYTFLYSNIIYIMLAYRGNPSTDELQHPAVTKLIYIILWWIYILFWTTENKISYSWIIRANSMLVYCGMQTQMFISPLWRPRVRVFVYLNISCIMLNVIIIIYQLHGNIISVKPKYLINSEHNTF